jgi:hypothetical protein
MNKAFTYNLTLLTSAFVGGLVMLSSCTKDPLSPGVEYMPDMYRSPSYETYSVNAHFLRIAALRVNLLLVLSLKENGRTREV